MQICGEKNLNMWGNLNKFGYFEKFGFVQHFDYIPTYPIPFHMV